MNEDERQQQEARIQAYVERVVAEAPPLTLEQREEIGRLLAPKTTPQRVA